MRRTPSVASLLAAGAAAALAVPTGIARAGDAIEGDVRLPRVRSITSHDTARPLELLEHWLPPAEAEAPPEGPVPLHHGR